MKTLAKTILLSIAISPALYAQNDRLDGRDLSASVKVNRWVSPVVGDFVTVPESHATDAQMKAWGYRDKIFQYEVPLNKQGGDVAVYRWTMPNCKEFIILAEHEHTDAELESWGYRDKKLLFYAYKTRPNNRYVAVNRWVNALPQGNPCRDYTLSVLETEFTDEQLASWGYSGKKVQFYVLKP